MPVLRRQVAGPIGPVGRHVSFSDNITIMSYGLDVFTNNLPPPPAPDSPPTEHEDFPDSDSDSDSEPDVPPAVQ